MRFLLMPNTTRQAAMEISVKLTAYLKELGAQPLMATEVAEIVGDFDGETGDFVDLLNSCDIVVPIGGDGTIFRSASACLLHDKPIVGVNGGRLGFLSQIEASDLTPFKQIMEGNYNISERMVLDCTIVDVDGTTKNCTCINDIVFSRGAFSKIVDIEITSGDNRLGVYRADGAIFSTPTGSTAYSLSAGGPIVDPNLKLIIITPICSHSFFDKSIVISPNETMTIKSKKLNNDDVLHVVADGEMVGVMNSAGHAIVKKHPRYSKFISLTSNDFYPILNQKLEQRR